MNDVIVRLIAMPLSVRAFTVPDEQGDYNIYLNEALSDEQLQKVLIITLGKQSEYNIRLGWKNKWSVTDSFVKTACEQVKLLNAATNLDY